MILSDKLDEYLKTSREEHEKPKNNEFHASSAGSCPRAMVINRLLPAKENLALSKIFLVGDLIHQFIQNKLLSSGKSEEKVNFDIEQMLFIRGRLDYIDDDYVWEFKSIASLAYVKDAPKPEHVKQINIYLKATNRTKGKIVYVEKNTFNMAEHEVTFDKELFNETIKEFLIVKHHLELSTLPDRLEGFPDKNWKCRYCDRREECLKGIEIQTRLMNGD
jgi:CRISPR-associated exonuclease Cas4